MGGVSNLLTREGRANSLHTQHIIWTEKGPPFPVKCPSLALRLSLCMSRGLCLHRKSPLPSSPLLQFLAVEKWRTHCAYLAFLDQDSLPPLPRPPSDPILRSQFVGRSRDLCVREISFYLSSSSEFCRSAGGILCDCREVGGGDIAGDGGSLSDIVQTQN